VKNIIAKALTVLGLLMLRTSDSFACSVCFGDPNSPMSLGAKAGVAVLLGIVFAVLSGILGITIYWIRRARMLESKGPGV